MQQYAGEENQTAITRAMPKASKPLMMVVRDSGYMMRESSTELDIDDHVRKESKWTTNLQVRQRYL